MAECLFDSHREGILEGGFGVLYAGTTVCGFSFVDVNGGIPTGDLSGVMQFAGR